MFFLPVFPELGNEVERLDQIWQAHGIWSAVSEVLDVPCLGSLIH